MRRRQRGNFAIITGVALAGILAMGALSIDSAYVFHVRQQAINAADAAAVAGATGLDGTEEGMTEALQRAQAIALANVAAGDSVVVEDADVTFGYWDDEVREFVASDVPEEVNAISVLARVPTGGLVGEVAFGRSIQQVSGQAVALSQEGPAGAVDCFLPIAIPSCLIEQASSPDAAEQIDMVLNPPGADNVGWARPDGNPNASWVRDQIRDCEYAGEVELGDTVNLNNGVMSSALTELAQAVEDSDTTWSEGPWGAMPAQESRSAIGSGFYGNTWEAPALVFEDDSYCGGGGSWTGTATLSGFVWVAVYDVVATGPASGKTIKVRIDTTRTHNVGTGSGGPSWGVSAAGGGLLVR